MNYPFGHHVYFTSQGLPTGKKERKNLEMLQTRIQLVSIQNRMLQIKETTQRWQENEYQGKGTGW